MTGPAAGLAALAAAVLLTIPALRAAEPIAGKATAVDGDTLDVAGRRVSLHGIDAPEAGQTCRTAAGATYGCGQNATFALANLVGRHWVHCVEPARDAVDPDGGRLAAVCTLAGATGPNLNEAMVRRGWALADASAPTAYVALEEGARKARRGLWAGDFVAPPDWRRGVRLE